MRITRRYRSGCPCGRRPRGDTFAAVNKDADPFGHAATHAPQPIQAAAPIAASAAGGATGTELASGALPVFTLTKPPAAMMRSSALRFTTRSRNTGKALDLHGSLQPPPPSLQERM